MPIGKRQSMGDGPSAFPFTLENNPSEQPRKLCPQCHLSRARTWHIHVYCASPANSSDAVDNKLEEGGQSSSGTLNSNRGNGVCERKSHRTAGREISFRHQSLLTAGHFWDWCDGQGKTSYRRKWAFWKDVRLLNPEDRQEVWRKRMRLQWWERKITQGCFWTDF